jgi:outer membrane lipoprotein-sorting protein
MNPHSRFFSSLAALVFVFFTGHSDGLAQSNEELVEWLRNRYETVDLLKAEFTQHTTSPFGDALPVNQGTLWLKGDLYRVETDIQTFVTDGETVWIFDESENQVLINDYTQDETTFSITNFLANFDTDYKVIESFPTEYNGEAHYEMRLQSNIDSMFFKEVTLWLRTSDHIISRLLVTDVNDAILDFRLDHIEINPPLHSDPFTIAPPGDAEVIDLRS